MFFKRRSVAWRAAQDSLEQADGFLSEAVAGEEVHIGKRLGNEFLRLFVKHRLFANHRRLAGNFRSRFFLLDRELGSRRLGNIRLQVFLRKLLAFSWRQEAHLAEHAIESALGGIALGFLLDELFERLLCFLPWVSGSEGISQTCQRVG